LGHINKRHENNLNYRETLKEKFGNVKEIKRMARHRHLPKYILNDKLKKQDQKDSKYRKLKNMEVNNPNQFKKPKPEREAKIQGIEQ
jgi:DDB1- and CUL4-associated factor 13